MGNEPISDIISQRQKNGAFTNLEDFIKRCDFSKMTKRALEPLVKSGALDGLGYSRACMLQNIDAICEKGRASNKTTEDSGLFDAEDFDTNVRFDFQDLPEASMDALLDFEFECLGIYVSAHPLDAFKEAISRVRGNVFSSDFENLDPKTRFFSIAKVLEIKRKIAKSGRAYATVTLLDLHGKFEVMAFEGQLLSLENLDAKEPCAIKFEVESDERDVYRLRILKIQTLQDAIKNRENDVQILKPAPKSQNFPKNTAFFLKIYNHAPQNIFSFVRDAAAENAGDRALKIVICDEKNGDFAFDTELFVDDKFFKNLCEILERHTEFSGFREFLQEMAS